MSTPATTEPAIRLAGARKVYGTGPGALVALDGVDLEIPAGRFVSVIGPSGCGKSTLLRLVASLERADSGTVEIRGTSPEEACAQKLVGFVPQTPALLPWLDVLQNVTLPQRVNRGAGRRRLRHAPDGRTAPDLPRLLREVGLGEAMHRLPAQLSGGMQQRVAIVRALGLQPEVLLMDEPFSALDEFTRESLQEQLLDLWDEITTTVMFVTHSVTEAVRLSDTVVVMAPKPGRIVDVIDIDLPRPRGAAQLKTADFHHFEDLIRDRLQSAWRDRPTAHAA
ncbi:ABC transporter ATP-binding protein [Agromyces intestinalis]|uniref:ABC transporter ATP-binding protein n=1 Tax=Agromyces intestinalis TaxID=2592652 RepID=A0A5C1YII5_9MICO|nr:ABC transporter ATP-binding protein [Agromyces intestinalis]QEO14929.1 ABC transporter ATP-binding protein [Agromyces intestinalis]